MNFILKNAKLTFMALIICFGFTACDEEDDFMMGGDDVTVTPDPDPTDDGEPESNTIVDFAAANGFNSLVAAVEAAGLTATLSGDTEYTVFAPTDDAFAAFLSDNGFSSLDEVPTDLLTQVLMNHVQAGSVMSTDLSTGYMESMAEAGPDGENVSLYVNVGDDVMLNGMSTVTGPDNEVDNGVVHAVDAVIGLPDVTTFATADPTFSSLAAALTEAELVETLQATDAPAPFTVFAPTDDAFATFLGDDALTDIAAETLTAVLTYHVVGETNAASGDLTDGMTVTTVQGQDLTINIDGETVTVTDATGETATVVAANVQATNGIIHAIDMVLMPDLE